MNSYFLKIPVYVTDEFGSGAALLILLIGVAIIFLAKLMGNSENDFISTLGEEIIFKLGIGCSLTGLIALLISFG